MRTSRKGYLRQITQIERRQSRIRRIRSELDRERSNPCHEASDLGDPSNTDSEARYHIGKTQNNPEHIVSFIQANVQDPAIKVSTPSYKK